jgi:hypothetical protein
LTSKKGRSNVTYPVRVRVIFAMTILQCGMKISKDSSVVVLATYQMVIQVFDSPGALKL